MEDSFFWGSGWSFPPTFELANQELNLTHKEENINQSIDLIMRTYRGERSMIPDFGSELRSFLFQTANETLEEEVGNSIKTTLLEYEPRITVNEVNATFRDEREGLIEVNVSYTIIKTNTRHNHVFPFSVQEGTNL